MTWNGATPASVGDKLKYSQSKYVFSKAKLYLSIILSAIVILVVGYFVFHNSQNADQEKRIAVLAFADMSPNKDQEHFADGLSEELINMLVRVPNLKVTARTSAFAFKGKDEDIRTIAGVPSATVDAIVGDANFTGTFQPTVNVSYTYW